MSTIGLDCTHAWHIRLSITKINHSFEWHGALIRRHKLVDTYTVADLADTLVDLKKELRLLGIIHYHRWPTCIAIAVIEVGASIDLLELLGNSTAFDHLLDTRTIDIVLDFDANLCCIGIDMIKPLSDTRKETYCLAKLAQHISRTANTCTLCLSLNGIHHHRNTTRIIGLGDLVAKIPKFRRISVTNSLQESELLHIARREGAVKVIYECYSREHIQRFKSSTGFKSYKGFTGAKVRFFVEYCKKKVHESKILTK